MNKITNRQAICDVLLEKAKTDRDIVVTCSDSRGSGSLTPFFNQYPAQSVEVGIAEQDLVGISAGLASCGKKVFAASPASFLTTRSYEQCKVDVAYSNTNVTLIGISGGVSYGALGMTHHSCQDFAAMSALTGMRVYNPSDRFQTAKLVEALLGKGKDVLLVACGEMVPYAKEAMETLNAKGISTGLIDMYCIKPFDVNTLVELAKDVKLVVSIEEHAPQGGLGSAVAQALSSNCPKRLVEKNLPDEHLIPGENTEMFAYYGLDAKGIVKTVEESL